MKIPDEVQNRAIQWTTTVYLPPPGELFFPDKRACSKQAGVFDRSPPMDDVEGACWRKIP